MLCSHEFYFSNISKFPQPTVTLDLHYVEHITPPPPLPLLNNDKLQDRNELKNITSYTTQHARATTHSQLQ